MTDSFFSTRTVLDTQIEQQAAPADVCQVLMEASVRRLAKLEGPIAAAERVQRIADICAGTYVLPIEHWKTVKPAEPAPKKVSRLERAWLLIVGNPGFWTGVFVGLYLGAM